MGSGFLINLTLIILFINCSFSDKYKIPEHVLEDLRNSRTLYEVTRRMNVRHGIVPDFQEITVPDDRYLTETLPVHRAGLFNKQKSKDVLERSHYPENMRVLDPGMVEIIDNPIQSKDSCQLFNICVALPMIKEPDMFYFPECIDLPQCLGACCDSSRNCRPKKTQAVKVKVTVWKYKGISDGRHQFLPDHNTHIEVKRHLQCNCDRCLIKPTCDERHHLVGCKCECNNEHEAAACNGEYRKWSDDTCNCECDKNTTCRDGYSFSPNACECMPSKFGAQLAGSGNNN